MRKPVMVFAVAIALSLSLLSATSFAAVEIPYRKPPFNVLTWPVQVLWQVVKAPWEAFKGGQQTVHTFLPDAKMPSVKMPQFRWPFSGGDKKPATDTAAPAAYPEQTSKGSESVPASVATNSDPQR